MKVPGQYFRAGAGAVILNGKGQVLAVERAKNPGAWQLPQGGLEPGEEPLAAVYREIQEEAMLQRSVLEFLGEYPELLAYELPAEFRSTKTGRGQVQYWFFFRLRTSESSITTATTDEVRNRRWMSWAELTDHAVRFRQHIYQRLHLHAKAYTGR